ncbi:MAG: NACHT domain-containing protein [Flavobacterium sp.]
MKLKRKITAKSKEFSTVKEKINFIHKNCHETELFEPLRLLFKAKGFENVEITHGNNEFGKDLVFSMVDSAIDEKIWYSAVVKNKNAQQNDFVSGGEIQQQVELSLKHPYINSSGKPISISRVFVIVNGSVTANARQVLTSNYDKFLHSSIFIWDYQKLISEIEEFTKELFLNDVEAGIQIFDSNQIKLLSDISKSNQLLQLNMSDIDEIFVNVQTSNSKYLKKVENYVQFDEDNKSKVKTFEDIDGFDEIINSDKNFIIHGIPTSGKSLYLKRLGIRLIKEKKNNLVFFFEFSSLVDTKNSKLLDLKDKMIEQFKNQTKDEEVNFESYDKIIVLIDSFDDIKNESIKAELLKHIDEFASTNTFKNIQLVIAMRTTDIIDKEKILNEFEKSELLPFNLSQALKLVEKIIPNNKSKSNAFLKAMKDSMLSSTILRTPLALTLMAILYRDETIDLEELPANITELYNKFVDTYLDRWDNAKGVTQQYKYEQTKNILGFIAMEIHLSESNYITEDDLKIFLIKLRKEFSYEEIDNPVEFINHLKLKTGVINFDENEKSFHFFNHYFQEYFVSLCIDESKENDLKDNFFEEWWENAIVFYCGKNPRRDVFLLDVSKNIIPSEIKDTYIYLNLLSKSLQANHAIPIKSRITVVKRMLGEFNKFINDFIKEGAEGNTMAAAISTMDLVLNLRDFFDKLFGSRHISSDECITLFENILLDENNNLSELTIYCISYFITFHKNDSSALELFSQKDNINIIWSRIVFIDLKLLHYKAKDIKSYKRIKRKMDRNKFLILERLNDISIKQLK